ncbi:MAG TPA: ABC transporter substrate-binding protein [Burkholderiales bacterium]|jgi:putative ABC transport system substrate-binding protein|nr:ABC transporter substrate-binding protein [Burkholderiales bacterium]
MTSRRQALAYLALAPAAAWAQPAPGVHRIGVLTGGSNPRTGGIRHWPIFSQAMRRLGYEEGRNAVYEFRYAEGTPARFPQLARELTAADVRMIVVTGSTETVAASQATATIPIVAIHVGDPVELRLAMSLARPGGNVTGMTLRVPGYSAKFLELLVEAFPKARRIGIIGNPQQPNFAGDRQLMERVAVGKGVTLLPTSEATRPEEVDAALRRVLEQRPDALIVPSLALFTVSQKGGRIIEFAAQAKLPAMYTWMEDVEAGGLIAFGVDVRALYARTPVFVDKILKGANPGEIPIEQPTRFGLWLNLKTARALGVKFPPTILARAEQTVE